MRNQDINKRIERVKVKGKQKDKMILDVYCENCPIKSNCDTYCEAREDNDNSYHSQITVRAEGWDCPLVKLIKPVEIEED